MNIHILTNNADPCSRAFNCPLILAKDLLAEQQISTRFYFKKTGKLFQSDFLFINSNVFRPYWQKDKKVIFDTLEKARENGQKIIWFDTTDSTWCTQFEVLPYVDLFLKNQIFRDRKQYLKKYRTGRIFTDYFSELYQVEEYDFEYALPPEGELEKIDISWAPCFENYHESRYSLSGKIKNLTRPLTANLLSEKFKIEFHAPAENRTMDISARFGLGHSRKSVVAHRQAVKEVLERLDVDCSRIPLPEYFAELRNSRLSVSPYGVGEFCYRDYESIACGATLVKPDMSHMSTWPNFYQEDKTYVPHKWDLSDLSEKIENLIGNPDQCRQIAENAQDLYKKVISQEGMAEFIGRLKTYLEKI